MDGTPRAASRIRRVKTPHIATWCPTIFLLATSTSARAHTSGSLLAETPLAPQQPAATATPDLPRLTWQWGETKIKFGGYLKVELIKALLKHGADLSLPNSRGITPTMTAAGLGSTDADTRGIYTTEDTQQRSIASLTLLLAAAGDVNAADARGLTPLHEAARWGWNDVVKFLVAKGANLEAKDNRGLTPVDSAMGRAGGNSRGGARIDVHEDTAALLKQMIAARAGSKP